MNSEKKFAIMLVLGVLVVAEKLTSEGFCLREGSGLKCIVYLRAPDHEADSHAICDDGAPPWCCHRCTSAASE
jgi:hypothetical protein